VIFIIPGYRQRTGGSWGLSIFASVHASQVWMKSGRKQNNSLPNFFPASPELPSAQYETSRGKKTSSNRVRSESC
jgi:hypothetical protein